MKLEHSLQQKVHILAQYFPHISIFAIISLLTGLCINGQFNLMLKGLILLLPILLILCLLLRNKNYNFCADQAFNIHLPEKKLIILFAICLFSLLTLILLGYRSIPYVFIFLGLYGKLLVIV